MRFSHRKVMKILIDEKNRARELQRRYLKDWRKKNKDKVRQYNEAYWLRKAQKEGGAENAKEKD